MAKNGSLKTKKKMKAYYKKYRLDNKERINSNKRSGRARQREKKKLRKIILEILLNNVLEIKGIEDKFLNEFI